MPFKNQHPLYCVWASMRNRCFNPNYRQWNDYGGRGIEICERWDDFHVFVKDMGERPNGYTLDRIDNNRGYNPENCRWASRKQQQLNRRISVYVEIEGRKYRAIDLAHEVGVKTDTIVSRAKRGLPLKGVMSKVPLRDISGFSLGGKANGRRQQAKTHCPKGHEYAADNISLSKDGYRRCKTCHRQRERIARAKVKEMQLP